MSSDLLQPLFIDSELADRLETDERFRRRYIRFFAQTEVAAEIRTLRKTRRLRQAEVAKLAKTGQSAISRIEKADYDGWTFKTLIAIAEELRARLRITFEPIEDVANGLRGLAEDQTAFVGGAGTGKSAAVAVPERIGPDEHPASTYEVYQALMTIRLNERALIRACHCVCIPQRKPGHYFHCTITLRVGK